MYESAAVSISTKNQPEIVVHPDSFQGYQLEDVLRAKLMGTDLRPAQLTLASARSESDSVIYFLESYLVVLDGVGAVLVAPVHGVPDEIPEYVSAVCDVLQDSEHVLRNLLAAAGDGQPEDFAVATTVVFTHLYGSATSRNCMPDSVIPIFCEQLKRLPNLLRALIMNERDRLYDPSGVTFDALPEVIEGHGSIYGWEDWMFDPEVPRWLLE